MSKRDIKELHHPLTLTRSLFLLADIVHVKDSFSDFHHISLLLDSRSQLFLSLRNPRDELSLFTCNISTFFFLFPSPVNLRVLVSFNHLSPIALSFFKRVRVIVVQQLVEGRKCIWYGNFIQIDLITARSTRNSSKSTSRGF